MTRQSRLQEYKRMAGPKGESTKANLDYWSNRASENSQVAPRATEGDGAKTFGTSDGTEPKEHKGDMRERGKSDKNHVASGETFMPGVRRQAD